MTALDELEKLAEAAVADNDNPDYWAAVRSLDAFHDAANPETILSLLSAAREGERLRRALLLALPYVEDAIAASPADQEFIHAALQSEKPHVK